MHTHILDCSLSTQHTLLGEYTGFNMNSSSSILEEGVNRNIWLHLVGRSPSTPAFFWEFLLINNSFKFSSISSSILVYYIISMTPKGTVARENIHLTGILSRTKVVWMPSWDGLHQQLLLPRLWPAVTCLQHLQVRASPASVHVVQLFILPPYLLLTRFRLPWSAEAVSSLDIFGFC